MIAAWLVAVTYVYFLLFAQFAFLHGVREGHAGGVATHSILATMAVAGVVASFATPGLARRWGFRRMLAGGLFTAGTTALVAAAVFVQPPQAATILLHLCSLFTGLSVGVSTVALAGGLRILTRAQRTGLKIGCGTGAAYLVCNTPIVFEAPAPVQCLIAGVVGCGGGLLALYSRSRTSQTFHDAGGPGKMRIDWYRPGGLALTTLAFLALVWFDSAAFAAVQLEPGVLHQVWSDWGTLMINGATHAAAAVVSGLLLDAGFFAGTWIAALSGLVAGASWFHTADLRLALAAPIYAAGVSFYSTALAAFAALRPPSPDTVSPLWRAAWIYAIAGWIGSTLGVGLAETHGFLPGWAPWAAILVLATTLAAAAALNRKSLAA